MTSRYITPAEAMARLRMSRHQMLAMIDDALPGARYPSATFQLEGNVVITTVVDLADPKNRAL